MNARIRLGLLGAAGLALRAVERVGGPAAVWMLILTQGALADARASARRELAVGACLRALQRLAAAEQAGAVLDVLAELGAPPPDVDAAQYLIAALDRAALCGLAYELAGTAHA
jgi:hypothetical protein